MNHIIKMDKLRKYVRHTYYANGGIREIDDYTGKTKYKREFYRENGKLITKLTY